MAKFALVFWRQENKHSVVPAKWIAEPKTISSAIMPTKGLCKWGPTSRTYPVDILELSESKLDLQETLERVVPADLEETQSQPTKAAAISRKRPLENDTDDMTQLKVKSRKDQQEEKKDKKRAEIEAVTNIEKNWLLRKEGQGCQKCKKIEESKDRVIKDLERKLNETITDLKESRDCIKILDDKLQLHKDKANKMSVHSSSLQIAKPSPSALDFLENILDSYGRSGRPCSTDKNQDTSESSDESTLESDSEEPNLTAFQNRRRKNIEELKALKETLGFKEITHATNYNKKVSSSTCPRSLVPETTSSGGEQTTIKKVTAKAPTTNYNNKISGSTCPRSLVPETTSSGGEQTIKKVTAKGGYTYELTSSDLALEQSAFTAGDGKKELVPQYGVYVSFVDLDSKEQGSKLTATGLMRNLIGIWYSPLRLAASSASKGINQRIRTAVFKYCLEKYPNCSADKLMRDLTNKCGEERRSRSK